MSSYSSNILLARTAAVKAQEHLEAGNIKKASGYLEEAIKRISEATAFETWDECDGNCESCDFEECRDSSEREELEFSKMMKKFAIIRLRQSIVKINERLQKLAE